MKLVDSEEQQGLRSVLINRLRKTRENSVARVIAEIEIEALREAKERQRERVKQRSCVVLKRKDVLVRRKGQRDRPVRIRNRDRWRIHLANDDRRVNRIRLGDGHRQNP